MAIDYWRSVDNAGEFLHAAPLAGFPAPLVERLLDVSHTFLDLAFDLLRHALHLLIRIAGRLANFLL